MRHTLTKLRRFFELEISSSRVFIGLYMLTTGIMRMITGNSVTAVNVFSARGYGLLLLLGGLFLLTTSHHVWRYHWAGRIAAIFCAALWLLIITNAWPAQAWVSISGAFVFVLALGNEVRTHEC
jgi:hypothetical protein